MNTEIEKDACELLDADHVAVKHLFVEYARLAMAAAEASKQQRRELAMQICSELTVHAQIEEEIFYPAVRDALPDAQKLVDDAESEHAQIKQMVAQIEGMAEAGPAMDDLVSQLANCVEHHVKEERDCMFTKARGAGLDLDGLGRQMKERQQALEAEASA